MLELFPGAPRLFTSELGRDVDAGAPNLDDVREEAGRLETKEVSAVLNTMSSDHLQYHMTNMNVVSPSASRLFSTSCEMSNAGVSRGWAKYIHGLV